MIKSISKIFDAKQVLNMIHFHQEKATSKMTKGFFIELKNRYENLTGGHML